MGDEAVGNLGLDTLFLDMDVLVDDYNNSVGGANGNSLVNNNDNTTVKALVKALTTKGGKGKTNVNTTMNMTMNANINTVVNGEVSGTGTGTRRVRGTRIRAMASSGNLRTIGMAFSSNVLFGADDSALDDSTATSLTGFTDAMLGIGGSVSITVGKCASGRN